MHGSPALPEKTLSESGDVISAASIEEQLDKLLASTSFRTSKRAPRFLRFIVHETLKGRAGELKERVIGIEVFDRSPDYDLTTDPIVRVAAGDLRKRIAQYYVQQGHDEELRVELLPGSYVPRFYRPKRQGSDLVSSPEPAAPSNAVVSIESQNRRSDLSAPTQNIQVEREDPEHPTTPSHLLRWTVSLCAFVLALAAIILSILNYNQPVRAMQEFWAPFLGGSQSTLLCVNNRIDSPSAPAASLDLGDSLKMTNRLGPKDVTALTRIAGFLGAKERPFTVVMANDITLTDFRAQPAVLIGAFDNPWAKKLLAGSRFTIDFHDNQYGIVDSKNGPGLRWTADYRLSVGALTSDFGIITRRLSPLTGQEELIIGGMGPYGTVAATEFLLNPLYFAQFSKSAPRGWKSKDVQIIIGVELVNGHTAPPRMLAFDVR